MDADPQQILNTVTIGVALASAWFWIYSMIRSLERSDFKRWLRIIVPQGILIAFAIRLVWGV